MIQRLLVVVVGALILGSGNGAAAEVSQPEGAGGTSAGRVTLPYVFYTPETRAGGGFATVWYFRGADNGRKERPSLLRTGVTYTTNRQLVLQLVPEIFLAGGRYLLGGEVLYKDFPDRFWGLGPNSPEEAEEEFTLLTRRVEVFAQKEMGPYKARLLAVGESARLKEFIPGGLLDGSQVPGVAAGRVAGVGLGVGYDTRDDPFAPGLGALHQVKAVWFREALGGDYDFTEVTADIRVFRPFGSNVLGFHGLARNVSGNAPFYHLSPLGGQTMLRGVYEGRFRDACFLAAQAELRVPLRGRWGAAAFAAAGTVATNISELDAGKVKASAGAGLRYRLDRSERINARLDVAAGSGGVNVDLALMEAF